MPVQKTYSVVDGKLQESSLTQYDSPMVKTFDYDFLLSQREAITKQAAEFAAARQAELDNINELISQAEVLGLNK